MDHFDFDKEKEILRGISAKHTQIHQECSKRALDELREQLQPGETLPKVKGIATEKQRAIYKEASMPLINEAMAEIEKIQAHVDAVKGAAPTQEAVNYITMLSLRANITQEDIEVATKIYGENYNAMRTINDIARQHDLAPVGVSPVEDIEAFAQAESRRARSYGTAAHEDSSGWAARDSFIKLFEG